MLSTQASRKSSGRPQEFAQFTPQKGKMMILQHIKWDCHAAVSILSAVRPRHMLGIGSGSGSEKVSKEVMNVNPVTCWDLDQDRGNGDTPLAISCFVASG